MIFQMADTSVIYARPDNFDNGDTKKVGHHATGTVEINSRCLLSFEADYEGCPAVMVTSLNGWGLRCHFMVVIPGHSVKPGI